MKRVLLYVLFIGLIIAGISTAQAELLYEINDDDTLTITGYEGDASDLEIPAVIDGKKVAAIGEDALRDITASTVTVSPELDSLVVGKYAFAYNSALTQFSAESSTVIVLEESAFANAGSLTSVKGCFERIDSCCFEDCESLERIELLDGSASTAIAGEAFSDCSALNEIVFPVSTPVAAGAYAFGYLDSLTSVNGVFSSIGDNCFEGCYALETVEIAEGSDTLVLGSYAFYMCDALQSFSAPADTAVSVGTGAFSGCSSLETVNAVYSVIEEEAFEECSSLASFTVPISEQEVTIGENVFYLCSALKTVYLPKNVIEIDSDNFHGLSGATFYVQKDSYAEQFIIDGGFKYEYFE